MRAQQGKLVPASQISGSGLQELIHRLISHLLSPRLSPLTSAMLDFLGIETLPLFQNLRSWESCQRLHLGRPSRVPQSSSSRLGSFCCCALWACLPYANPALRVLCLHIIDQQDLHYSAPVQSNLQMHSLGGGTCPVHRGP